MYCPKCGKELPDGSKACPDCGESFVSFSQKAENVFAKADQEVVNAIHNVAGTGTPTGNQKLQTNRSLVMYILLSLVTCGIYAWYFVYKMAHDINIACDGDGESTSGLVAFILLSILTCGFYEMFWEYKLANRLASNANRYGLSFQENGTSVLMWRLFGVLLCGIGPFISMHILVKNSNKICAAYNQANHL